MGARYLKSEILVLKAMYPSATREEILAKTPGRSWTVLCEYARHKLNLHRSRKAIGLAVVEGLAKAKQKREEKK